MGVWPFLANMHDQSSAFETLIAADDNGIQHFDTSISKPPVSS
jgi:aryl-alcohol dehydrogenase-like predicted oxidoreductase